MKKLKYLNARASCKITKIYDTFEHHSRGTRLRLQFAHCTILKYYFGEENNRCNRAMMNNYRTDLIHHYWKKDYRKQQMLYNNLKPPPPNKTMHSCANTHKETVKEATYIRHIKSISRKNKAGGISPNGFNIECINLKRMKLIFVTQGKFASVRVWFVYRKITKPILKTINENG